MGHALAVQEEAHDVEVVARQSAHLPPRLHVPHANVAVGTAGDECALVPAVDASDAADVACKRSLFDEGDRVVPAARASAMHATFGVIFCHHPPAPTLSKSICEGRAKFFKRKTYRRIEQSLPPVTHMSS